MTEYCIKSFYIANHWFHKNIILLMLKGKEKFPSRLLGYLSGSENYTDKDILTGEKNINLLIFLPKEIKTASNRPECFQSRQSWKNVIG